MYVVNDYIACHTLTSTTMISKDASFSVGRRGRSMSEAVEESMKKARKGLFQPEHQGLVAG